MLQLLYLCAGFLAIILIVAALPIISGIGSYRVAGNRKVGKEVNGGPKKGSSKQRTVMFKLKNNPGLSAAKSASAEGANLRKRSFRQYNSDPSVYDYDINELIEEDAEREKSEYEEQYREYKGQDQERNEELV